MDVAPPQYLQAKSSSLQASIILAESEAKGLEDALDGRAKAFQKLDEGPPQLANQMDSALQASIALAEMQAQGLEGDLSHRAAPHRN